MTIRLKGITGEFKITAENGVFITLLAIMPVVVGTEVYSLPRPIGFKEWLEMGGSLAGSSKVRYSYGRLSCHKNQIEK